MIVVVGTGAMAKAMIRGFLKQQIDCIVVGRNEARLKEFEKEEKLPTAPLRNFDINDKEILLAIKPHALQEVAKELSGNAKICYSILAATPLSKLRQTIQARHYVRAMPNIAAAKLASTTALCGDASVKEKAIDLFGAIGKTIWLENETKLDIATAIAGSGPAFLAIVAEAMADGGVASGLQRSEAKGLVEGLFQSYAAIASEHPALIKDAVASPAGTTIAGIRKLEEKSVRSAFFEAVMAAFERSRK